MEFIRGPRIMRGALFVPRLDFFVARRAGGEIYEAIVRPPGNAKFRGRRIFNCPINYAR